MTRIIFLDIDGVLNDTAWIYGDQYQRERKTFEYPSPEWESTALDPVKVNRLNQILEETDAKIVISSAWRILNTAQELQTALELRGFRGEIIGMTDHKTPTRTPSGDRVYPSRGDLIQRWIDQHDVDSYVILEDDVDSDMPEDRTVQTRFRVPDTEDEAGLLDKDVERAISILNRSLA